MFKRKVQLQDLPEEYPNLEQVVAYYVYHSGLGNPSRRRQAEASRAPTPTANHSQQESPQNLPLHAAGNKRQEVNFNNLL